MEGEKRFSFGGLWTVIKNSFSGFSDDYILKYAAALAYYTIFSLGPLLVIIIALCSIFFGREAVEGGIYHQLEGFVGHDTAIQLQEIIKNAAITGKGKIAVIIGGVTLLFGATSVFAEMQESINIIWGLKPKPKSSLLKYLQNRFLSFSIIISLGFLLLVSLGISALIEALSNHLSQMYPNLTVVFFYILNLVITFAITTLIFSVIFRVLPDADIRWKDVRSGSIMTAVLFMVGKFGISYYITKSNVGSTFGAAGSLVILLLWIYYTSIILYFGAEFTKAYAVQFGTAIHPSPYAVTTKQVEVETGKVSIQAKDAMEHAVVDKSNGEEKKVTKES